MQNINNQLNGCVGGFSLSDGAVKLLEEWEKDKAIISRPYWKDIFLIHAYNIAQRSPDGSTKHGAIITNDNNEIVVEGFNGFIRGIDEKTLPNINESKYAFMIHAEENAILNAARQGKSIMGCAVYITGLPCVHCYQLLWQAGIKKIICGKTLSTMNDNKDYKSKMEILKFSTGNAMPIMEVNIDQEYILKMISVLNNLI